MAWTPSETWNIATNALIWALAAGWIASKLLSRIKVCADGVHAQAMTNAADGNQTSRKE